MWSYRPGTENFAANPVGGHRRYLGGDQAFANSTGGTPAAIGDWSFTVRSGEVWAVELHIFCLGVSGGGKFSISGPATPNLLTMQTRGVTSGITAYSTDVVTALDTLSAAYNTSAVTAEIAIIAVIAPSANGTVSFNAANVTNSNSFAIKAGSYMMASRIA